MISRLLAFILAFTFTIPTLPNNYSVVSSAYARSCPQGQVFNKLRNECVLSAKSIQAKQAAQNCEGKSGQEKTDCYNQVANEKALEVDTSVPEDFNAGFLSSVGVRGGNWGRQATIQIVNALMLYYMMIRGTKPTCTATSFWFLLGAGGVATAGELTANINYKMSMRKLIKEYKEYQNSLSEENQTGTTTTISSATTSTTENQDPQVKAFDYLINQEKERKTAASIRGGAYSIAGALYLIGAIFAAIEASADAATLQASKVANTCIDPTGGKDATGTAGIILGVVATAGGAFGAIGQGFIEEGKSEDSNNSSKPEETQDNENEEDQNNSYFTPIEQNPSLFVSKEVNHNDNILNPQTDFYSNWIDHTGYEIGSEAGFFFPFSKASPEEIKEISLRSIVKIARSAGENVMNLIIPSVYAQDKSQMNKENFIDEDGNIWTDAGKELLVPLTYIVGTTGVASLLGIMSGVNAALATIFATPEGRIIVGGVLAAYSGFIAGFSFAAAMNSSERIEALEEVRDKYVNNGGSNLDPCESRDDPSKPSCYCYDEQGEKNYARANSQICLNKWGEGGIIQPTDYTQMASGSTAPKGCVTNDGQFDGACNCRYAKDRNKKCKTMSSSMNFGGVGNNAWMQAAVGQGNAITNGQMSGADVAAGQMQNTAMRAQKMLDKMIKDHPKLKNSRNKIAKAKKSFRDFNNKLLKRVAASVRNNPNTSSAMAGIKSPADALKAAKESLKKESTLKFSGGAGGQKAAGQKEDGMDFDFGMGEVTPGMDPTQLADAMDKEYDFKGDIHNNPDNNIFDILTLRYQRSGLRRLFDDTGSTIADEPSKTDINKK